MKDHRPARPTFFWQGCLIVLPAAVLATFGLLALRQDRLLVHEQAAENARKLAAAAVQTLLPAALEAPTPGAMEMNGAPVLPARPEEDLVFRYSNQTPGWMVSVSDSQGDLVYPLPEGLLLPSENQTGPALEPSQQAAWNRAQATEFPDNNLAESIAGYQRFLETAPPARFQAQALYRIGVLSASSGETQAARECFARVRRDFPAALSESGVLLGLYAALHWLELSREPASSTNSALPLVNSICAEAVLRFAVLAPALLDQLEANASSDRDEVRLWRRVWEAQQRARHLRAAWQRIMRTEQDPAPAGLGPRWMDLGADEEWLVLTSSINSNLWLWALPEPNVSRCVETALRGLAVPNYLGVECRVADRALTLGHGERLAVANLAGSRTRPSAEVSVRLIDPGFLYAQQRARSYWFGSLIVLTSLTMLIGLLAAHRAFLRQRELSEMKTNFVSSVSHELRSPIASVRLMAEELNDMPASDLDKSRSYHGFIVQECRRLSALIENVLDFSRHEQGRKQYQFEPTDLSALIRATAELMRTYAADKQVVINTVLPVEPVEIEADGRALQQVLVNLVDNAIKHSPANSTITVGLDSNPFAAASNARLKRSFWQRFISFQHLNGAGSRRAGLRFWVEDQGEGIPPEEQERIFERFYRPGSELRRETQGVGLGLAIVKYITEAHGGRVHVRSAVGAGSRFTIELPLTNPPLSTANERS